MSGVLGGTLAGNNQKLVYVDSFSNNFTASQSTFNHPATVQVGDYCIIFHSAWDNDSDFINGHPAGFTGIYLNEYLYTTSTYLSVSISGLVLPNLNSVTTGTVNGTPDQGRVTALYFRPSYPISSITPSTINNTNTTTDPTAQTVSSGSLVPSVIVFGFQQGTSTTPAFNAATTAFDQTITNTAGTNQQGALAVGFKIYNSNPVNHTVDMDDLGNQRLTSFSLKFT